MPGAVPTGVADLAISPPLGGLQPVLDEHGPYGFGDHTIGNFLTTTFHGILPPGTWDIGGTYGVIVVANGAIPLTWGYEIGYDSGGAIGNEGFIYENRFAQVVIMKAALGGFKIPVELVDCQQLATYIPLPFSPLSGDTIGLHVTPSVAVDLYFMALLG